MGQTVTLELSEDVARCARAEATRTRRRLEDVVVDWLDRLVQESRLETRSELMTRSEVEAYRSRWNLVNQREIEELRATSAPTKFKQLAALMASIEDFAWPVDRDAEDSTVRERWQRLRQAVDG